MLFAICLLSIKVERQSISLCGFVRVHQRTALYLRKLTEMVTQSLNASYYGQVVKSRTGRDIILTETRYSPHFKIPKHSHRNPYLGFVLEGAFSETYEQPVICESTTLVFHPAEQMHSESFHNTGGRLLNIEIQCQWVERFRGYAIVPERTRVTRAALTNCLASKIYLEFKHFDEVSPLAIEGLLLELLAESYRCDRKFRDNRTSRWLKQVEGLLHDRFAEPLTLQNIADLVVMNPVYIAQTFRHYYGCTVGEYIRQLRVGYSCRAISRSDAPFSQIATRAGFSDQAHFCRVFKRIMGMTPSQYRSLVRSS